MRAIGKGSLASILAVGLNIARIVLWIAFVGITIAMVIMPIVAIFSGGFVPPDNISIDGDINISAGDYIEVAHAFVTVAVLLFVTNRLLAILKTLRFGSPFVMENADHFRSLGYALMIGEASKIAFGILSLITDADLDIEFEFISWIAVIAVFVLSEVFREGARMKEEQDLTV